MQTTNKPRLFRPSDTPEKQVSSPVTEKLNTMNKTPKDCT